MQCMMGEKKKKKEASMLLIESIHENGKKTLRETEPFSCSS